MIKTIVIAWSDKTGIELTDELECFDGINWKHKINIIPEGSACVWLNKGTEKDVEKATEFSKTLTDHIRVAVYEFEPGDQECLKKAREMILNE